VNKTLEILRKLRPEGGWILTGEDFNSVQWVGIKPITNAEYSKELLTIEDYVISKEQNDIEAKATAKAELLAKLGITAEEAALLLG